MFKDSSLEHKVELGLHSGSFSEVTCKCSWDQRESPGAAVLVGVFIVWLVGLVRYCLFFFSLQIMSGLKAMNGDAC